MKPPVFVGGIARSGTTLMQMMLDSHPAVSLGIEISERAANGCVCFKHGECDSCTYYLNFVQAACGLEVELIAHVYRLCERICGKNYAKDSQDRMRFIGMFYESLGLQMALRAKKGRWGFKLMHSFQYGDALLDTFKGAKLIHVIRDGLDVFASWKEQELRPGSLSKRDPKAIAEEWVQVVGAWKPEWGLLVRYEQLVMAPRFTMQQVLTWLGEPWNEAVLSHEKARHVLFDTQFEQPSREQVQAPVHHRQVGRWRRDLAQEEVDAWLTVGGELRWKMGYA